MDVVLINTPIKIRSMKSGMRVDCECVISLSEKENVTEVREVIQLQVLQVLLLLRLRGNIWRASDNDNKESA